MWPVFCFIDDSPFELEVFTRNIIPAGTGIEFILGSTYEETRTKVKDRYPSLFLLDLYGRDPALPPARLPSWEELAAEAGALKPLADVYSGLVDYPGDKVNEFLKRLFHVVDGWRRLFYRASRQAGQNINYGMSNLAAVRRDYPGAAAIGYTRKSLIMDAVEVMTAGIDGLSLKPDGPDDSSIHRATRVAAPGLLAHWAAVVTRCQAAYLKDLALQLYESAMGPEVSWLAHPEKLSPQAVKVLGPDRIKFLTVAAEWAFFVKNLPART